MPTPQRPYLGLGKPRARFSNPEQQTSAPATSEQTARVKKSHSVPTPRSKTFVEVPKSKDGRTKPRAPTLAEQFSGQLDDYREQLYHNAETNLEESKIKHTDQIEGLADQLEQQLSLMSRCEQQLNSSIAEERINTTAADDHGLSGGSDEPRVLMSERMSEFGAILKAKETTLQRLFDDWNDVQAAIIALAVQALGKEALDIDEEHLHPRLTRAISKAAARHAEAEKQTNSQQAKVDQTEARVKNLATKTTHAVDQAFKHYTLEMARLQKEVNDVKKRQQQLRDEWGRR